MHFPIPAGLAETAARDMAEECRKLAAEAVKIQEAVNNGEANDSDKEKLSLLIKQIRDLADCVMVCMDSKREYRVADYVTKGREFQSLSLRKIRQDGLQKLRQSLLH